MKRNIRIFAVLLVICMFMTSINVYALDTNKDVAEERIFTKAELACMTDGSFGTATGLSDEFIEVKNIEGKSTRASTTYYIIETTDGYMLTSPTSGTFSRTRYANSGSNNVRKWIFTEDSDGDYIVYSYTDSTKCLTINPSTKAVTLSTYTGSEYQKWRMYYSGNGNTLRSMANDSTVSGYKLVINGSSCYVSNTTYTPVGFFDVSWYTPVSTLSYSNFYLALEQNKTVTPTKSPSDANCSNNWINWSSSNTSKFTVNDNGKVTGVSAGTATLTFRDKITRKYGTCTITVMPIANGTYYLKNRENSDYAKVKNATMSNGNNVVQYDFGEGNEFRWIFTLNTSTGYFSIKSANSSSDSYYMVVSDDSSELDKPIVIRRATETSLTDGMQWKVEATTNGAYKIIPKTGEATNYVLATSVSTGTNNKNLLQGDYLDNNSYRDEWLLFDVSKKYSQVSLGYSGASSFNAKVKQYYETNASAYGLTYTSINESDFIYEMKNATYFGGMLHGGEYEDKLQISSSEVLYLSEISSLPNADFNSVKIVILTSCYSGRINGFVDTLLSKGVDVVIGFSGQIEQETSAFWTERLIYALTQGNTVQYSIDYANAELDEEYSGSYYADCRSLIKWGLYTGTSDLSSTPCS